ncbi:FkbM family methyltransferase [Aequorivita sinensis]|uniref:FkbM family methyltransferase n=1 Tax=Aequorivita sinensis TaxID=1382458 RepID=UPI002301EFD0|nr:FkbM family methyltransferase [Aequorivita sinensis]
MKRLRIYQIICAIFPPIISQSIRNIIFPLPKARKLGIEFSKTSITGSKFHGTTSDDHSYRFAIHGFFDWRNIIIANKYVKEYRGDIIEIGANVGTETISYCDLVAQTGQVHAFEPLLDNVQALNKLSKYLENLVIYPKAVSNKTQIVEFQVPPPHESGIGKIISKSNSQKVSESLMIQSITLDSLINNFKRISFVSIDTEGHEPFVLEGAHKVLSEFRPSVIIEISPKLLRKYSESSSEDIHDYFRKLDYQCYIIDRSSIRTIDKINVGINKSQNWFCVPSENSHIVDKISKDLLIRAYVPWYLLKSLKYSV